MWFETGEPNFSEAKAFAETLHAKFPGMISWDLILCERQTLFKSSVFADIIPNAFCASVKNLRFDFLVHYHHCHLWPACRFYSTALACYFTMNLSHVYCQLYAHYAWQGTSQDDIMQSHIRWTRDISLGRSLNFINWALYTTLQARCWLTTAHPLSTGRRSSLTARSQPSRSVHGLDIKQLCVQTCEMMPCIYLTRLCTLNSHYVVHAWVGGLQNPVFDLLCP